MSEINIKITNAKQLIAVLKDINSRCDAAFYDSTARILYKENINTLIKVLEEAK